MEKECPYCKQLFNSSAMHKIYCSIECQKQARNERIITPNNKKQVKFAKENRRQIVKTCVICNKEFILRNNLAIKRQCCYDCMPEGCQFTRSQFTALLKEKFGGACQRCGYNTTYSALEFHHLDPNKKDFTIGNSDFQLAAAVNEVKKCVLLCANCHRELHDKLWDISELNFVE